MYINDIHININIKKKKHLKLHLKQCMTNSGIKHVSSPKLNDLLAKMCVGQISKRFCLPNYMVLLFPNVPIRLLMHLFDLHPFVLWLNAHVRLLVSWHLKSYPTQKTTGLWRVSCLHYPMFTNLDHPNTFWFNPWHTAVQIKLVRKWMLIWKNLLNVSSWLDMIGFPGFLLVHHLAACEATDTLWWTNIAMENYIFNGKINYKWPFSIAMLVHQRVVWLVGHCHPHQSWAIPCDRLKWMWKTRDFPRKMIYKWWACHIYVGLHESVNVNMIWEERSPCSSPFLPAWKLQKRHASCGGIPYFWINNIGHLTLSQEPTSNIHQFLKVIEDGLPLLAQSISIPVFISRCIAHSLHLLLGFQWERSTVASWCQLMSLDVRIHCLGILPYTKFWPIHPPTWLVQMVWQCLNPRRSWLKHHLLDCYPLNPQGYCLHRNYDCYMGNPNRLPLIIQHSNMITYVYLGFIYKHLQMSHVP